MAIKFATFNLSTLNLAGGTHSITAVAKANGYLDSEPSNAVSYVVEQYSTEGLAYTLSDDGAYYICSGIGTATATNIIIASEYEGLPVTTIDYSAFLEESSLTSVIIPDSIVFIKNLAFARCENLKSITIPDSVTSIGDLAFSRCSGLTSVVIGSSVTSIEDSAFAHCRSLTSITFEGTVARWNSISKGLYWNDEVPATKVVCSNGEVSI